MTTLRRRIGFNVFTKNTIGHQSAGLWRYPGDQSLHYKDMEYWQNLSRLAEEGLFDAIFVADALGVHDRYRGNDLGALRTAFQVPVNDPLGIALIGAAVTRHIGFGITFGTPFEHPFPFARRLSTLDHFTKGRIAWNIVTGYLPSANRNMGSEELPHDERYDYAEEYMEVIYKLLEGSWEDDAVILDRESGAFADPHRIHHIGHHGRFFDVPGAHLCEPSIQRTPVLFQAGNSTRGRRFAATHAEGLFISPINREYARTAVRQVRDDLIRAGRDPHSARIYALATIITDATQELAEAKWRDLLSYVNKEGVLVANSGWLGNDLSKFEPDAPLVGLKSNASLGNIDTLHNTTTDDGRVWTLRDRVEQSSIGGAGPKIIGDAKFVADYLEDFVEYTDVDGFNLSYGTIPGSFEDIVHYVVPELQKRGLYQEEYAPGSLRNQLFGHGDRLPQWHIGAQYRVGGPRSTINDYAPETGRVEGRSDDTIPDFS